MGGPGGVTVSMSESISFIELETPAITWHSSWLVVPFLFAPGCAMQCVMSAGHFHGRDGNVSIGVDGGRGRAYRTNPASVVTEEGPKS